MKNKKALGAVPRYSPESDVGLTDAELASRSEAGIRNAGTEKAGKSYGQIFLTNFFSIFACILYGVAIAYIAFMIYESANGLDESSLGNNYFSITSIGFLMGVFVNIIIGVFQECRAKMATDRLKLVTKQVCEVVRNGAHSEIPFDGITLDDIVVFKAGSMISIDGPVVKGFCSVNESMLTGESNNIDKRIGDEVHSGTIVVSGEIYVRADKIGDDTTASKIKRSISGIKAKKSKMLSSLLKLIRILAIILIPVTMMTLIGQLTSNWDSLTDPELITRAKAFSILLEKMGSVIAGVIPIGLLLLSSVTLAASAFRLSKVGVIVKEMYSIETLSRVDTICFDKTGTLSTGELRVEKIDALAKKADCAEMKSLIGAYCHALPEDNATAKALNAYFQDSREYSTVEFKPFDSSVKRTEVTLSDSRGKIETYAMGAPEYLFKGRPAAIAKANEYAEDGFRVVGFGLKTPKGIEPIALIVISDEIRESIFGTIRYFNENNVAVKVISGDSPITVSALAKRAGILNYDKAISLEGVPDDKIIELAEQYTIFSRVTPEQKRLIVEALQKRNRTVAFCGDGINDVLGLKQADIGISFGYATDAAKQLADLVLTDNDFGKMTNVIGEGRRVLNGITRSAVFFLAKNMFTLGYQVLLMSKPDWLLMCHQLFWIAEFISAAGGFMLALENNSSKYEGEFMTNIMSKAIPASVYLILSVIAVDIYGAALGYDFSDTGGDLIHLQNLATIAYALASFAIFYKQCSPFNKHRTFTYSAVMLICLILIFLTPQIFVEGSRVNIMKYGLGAIDQKYSILWFIFSGLTADNYWVVSMQSMANAQAVTKAGTLALSDLAYIGVFGSIGIPIYGVIYNIVNLILAKTRKSIDAN